MLVKQEAHKSRISSLIIFLAANAWVKPEDEEGSPVPLSADPRRCGRNNPNEIEPLGKAKLREEKIAIGKLSSEAPTSVKHPDGRKRNGELRYYTPGGHETARSGHPYMS